MKGECLNLLGLFNPRFAHTNMLNIKLPRATSYTLTLPPPLAFGARECGTPFRAAWLQAMAVLATRVIAGARECGLRHEPRGRGRPGYTRHRRESRRGRVSRNVETLS